MIEIAAGVVMFVTVVGYVAVQVYGARKRRREDG